MITALYIVQISSFIANYLIQCPELSACFIIPSFKKILAVRMYTVVVFIFYVTMQT